MTRCSKNKMSNDIERVLHDSCKSIIIQEKLSMPQVNLIFFFFKQLDAIAIY